MPTNKYVYFYLCKLRAIKALICQPLEKGTQWCSAFLLRVISLDLEEKREHTLQRVPLTKE